MSRIRLITILGTAVNDNMMTVRQGRPLHFLLSVFSRLAFLLVALNDLPSFERVENWGCESLSDPNFKSKSLLENGLWKLRPLR